MCIIIRSLISPFFFWVCSFLINNKLFGLNFKNWLIFVSLNPPNELEGLGFMNFSLYDWIILQFKHVICMQ